MTFRWHEWTAISEDFLFLFSQIKEYDEVIMTSQTNPLMLAKRQDLISQNKEHKEYKVSMFFHIPNYQNFVATSSFYILIMMLFIFGTLHNTIKVINAFSEQWNEIQMDVHIKSERVVECFNKIVNFLSRINRILGLFGERACRIKR